MDKMVESGDFYISLAHLFYAIAAVDKRIEIEEKKRIRDLVEKQWKIKIDHADSETIIYSTLKKLIKEKMKSEDAFTVFNDFYIDNRELFTEELKKIILDHTTKIALSYSEINKSESVLISRLYFLMKEKK